MYDQLKILRLKLVFILLLVASMEAGRPLFADSRQENSTVVINEIHYDPDVKTELVEFVELYNPGSAHISLAGWYINDGISYRFPVDTILPASGYLIVVQNQAHVRDKWPNIPSALVFGPFEGKLDNDGEKVELFNADGEKIDQVDYQLGFPWPNVGDAIPDYNPGTGHSIQLINPSIDNDLAGSWRSASPTPAAYNQSVYLDNTPPHIRQVAHSPKQPKSGETVTITAKVTDSDGVSKVTLRYQIVDPGNYININDWQYNTSWFDIAMHDDGFDGDEMAGDDIYTTQIPGALQVHRRLVRYRIEVEDNNSNSLVVPYSDDPQPNFAYFVYDGVPPWSGAIRPNDPGPMGEVIEYGTDVMCSLPVYHLLTKEQDVSDSQYLPGAQTGRYGGSEYRWYGTLVYDGQVYDHIRYRARGGVWRYAMGKNMWKFDFNRGHYFQARDDYGRKYDTTWDKLNFSACIQQGDYLHRGEQGMFEAAAFKLFNLMGVEAPKTNWLQFRVINNADEFGPTQYDGDFWGLYMTIEQMDGRFLDEHNLPDGNLYKIESYNGELNNQGPTAATDRSDLNTFMSLSNNSIQWWRQNVSLERYYSYRCVVEGIHHGDIGYGKNYFFYLNPDTNIWFMLPWDVDLTWAENMYGNGRDIFMNQGDIFSHKDLVIEYRNRMREFLDLLYNTDQLCQILDELANIIDPATWGHTIVDADRALWDYNPIMTSGYVNGSKAGQGRFYQQAGTKDFGGMVQLMKDYVVYATNNTRYWYGQSGPSMNEIAADLQIPDTPTVTATCSADFPADALTFETDPFSDSQGNDTFAAMKWRMAEVAPGSQFTPAVNPQGNNLVLIGQESPEWKYFKGTEEPSNPVDAWRDLNFNDGSWPTGRTSIGYGDNDDNTILGDMQNNYTSLYLRHKFDVSNIDEFETLTLKVYVDDGCIIWINSTEISRIHVSGEFKSYDDITGDVVVGNAVWEEFVLSKPHDYLVEGENIIAIHVLNGSLTSSDVSIDIALTAEKVQEDEPPQELPSETTTFQGIPGKYEIDALWESDEITSQNSRTITIPVGIAEPGHTYRVRCRMKDNTGGWSHWSAPVQFEAGEPLSAAVINDLRITELMYNPLMADIPGGEVAVDNENFEFIELKNIGFKTIDLSGVKFTDGIDFAFSNFELGAGQYAVIVSDQIAFESRYGLLIDIAGQCSGRLDNAGERITLENAFGQTILDFRYEDQWYGATDGQGFSLTIVDPTNPDPNSWNLKYSWRASTNTGGSPGRDDP